MTKTKLKFAQHRFAAHCHLLKLTTQRQNLPWLSFLIQRRENVKIKLTGHFKGQQKVQKNRRTKRQKEQNQKKKEWEWNVIKLIKTVIIYRQPMRLHKLLLRIFNVSFHKLCEPRDMITTSCKKATVVSHLDWQTQLGRGKMDKLLQ